VGPESPAVYWRRRAAVIAGIIVVAVIIAMIINALMGDGRAREPKQSPVASATKQSGATAPACSTANLTVTLAADKQTFPAGEIPTFTATVTNTGKAACLLDEGSAASILEITSGTDRIFNSGDCAGAKNSGAASSESASEPAAPESASVSVAPGAARDLKLTWDKVRSNESCSPDLPAPVAGAKYTYIAEATVAGVKSDKAPFSFE
jgi:hypothetical protein